MEADRRKTFDCKNSTPTSLLLVAVAVGVFIDTFTLFSSWEISHEALI